jgi:hypothetical protein
MKTNILSHSISTLCLCLLIALQTACKTPTPPEEPVSTPEVNKNDDQKPKQEKGKLGLTDDEIEELL